MKAVALLSLVVSLSAFAPNPSIVRQSVAINVIKVNSQWSMDDPAPEVSQTPIETKPFFRGSIYLAPAVV